MPRRADWPLPWSGEAVEAIARSIHDEGGGCCERGYDGCDEQEAAQDAAVVALSCWFAASLRLVSPSGKAPPQGRAS